MNFDGIDDYIGIPTINFEGVDFEWNVTIIPKALASNVIFGRGGVSTLRINSASEILMLDYNNINLYYFSLTPNLELGEEYKIRVLRSGNELKLYVNGILQDTNIVQSNDNFGINQIGKRGLLNYFEGSIYDININNEAIYNGYGNTDADWVDQVSSNDGTINGNPDTFTRSDYTTENAQLVSILSPGDVVLLCFKINDLPENRKGILRLFGKNLIPDFTEFTTLSSQTTRFVSLYP